MSPSHYIPVYVRNLAGQYLAGDGEHWELTLDISKAYVFDYFGDNVAAQLEEAQRKMGIVWVAAPVQDELALEKCDLCGITITSRVGYFDGTRILCPVCHDSL